MARTALRLRQKKIGVGLLVIALAHLHMRNLARKKRHAANDNIFSDGSSC
jgi:hypothetical protein